MNPYSQRASFFARIITVWLAWQIAALGGVSSVPAPSTTVLHDISEVQPLLVNVRQMTQAMKYLGSPFTEAELGRLAKAAGLESSDEIAREIQAVLDPHCMAMLKINPESRIKAAEEPVAKQLIQARWLPFLVKIHNEAGSTAVLNVSSAEAGEVYDKEYCEPQHPLVPVFSPPVKVNPVEAAANIRNRWLDLEVFRQQPMSTHLSGAQLEYAILLLQSRDAGHHSATFAFDVGQGTQDIGFRSELTLTFAVVPATRVFLRVTDEKGAPCIGGFLIRDVLNRVYPSPFKRLAPDFSFQPQVYRADGETVLLAPGNYTIEFSRGPESIKETRSVSIGSEPRTLEFQVSRWIDPAALGYYSGDHHIHAAGCAHYTNPTQGVTPADMARQIQGEDLKVGAALTWGPCFDYQKRFFTGRQDDTSMFPYILRYDIEVSGFGSHRTGHLCLLRLKDQIYPGGDSMEHWPTLGLNILRWAKAQGAICGSPHSGMGLQIKGGPRENTAVIFANEVPFYQVPVFSGIGAMEYIVDVTHEVPGPSGRLVPAIDFISSGNTNVAAVLTMWYHTLNCGFRQRISGETDFPCMTDERVGHGRSYIRTVGTLSYDNWCQGLAEGRGYVSDGRSHLINFRVNEALMGEGSSELQLGQAATVKVRVQTAALLEELASEQRLAWIPTKRSDSRLIPPPSALTITNQRVYAAGSVELPWHLERDRIGDTRKVLVEVVVNGLPVDQREIVADGTLRELEFDVRIANSSWVAVRILNSSHTNPVFVIVNGKPIRTSKRSAQWCLAGVNQCWERNQRFYAETEIVEAKAAYDHARKVYTKIMTESEAD